MKRPAKEQSRQLSEFARVTNKYSTVKHKNMQSMRIAPAMVSTKNASRSNIIQEGLPANIRQFIKQTQKQFASVPLLSGSIFVGELSPLGAQGLGFCQEPDRSYYYGDWKDGKKNGRGTYARHQGSTYKGEWVNDVMHGTGMMK